MAEEAGLTVDEAEMALPHMVATGHTRAALTLLASHSSPTVPEEFSSPSPRLTQARRARLAGKARLAGTGLIHVDKEGSPVSGQPPVKVEVGGTDTESVSNRFFLGKTTVARGKFHSTWECMTNFLEKFSEEHQMPTLLSRISVSCFDILDSMSGRGGAIISLGVGHH